MDAIKIDNLTRLYGHKKVLDSLSFSVQKGHVHGFLGPNGAGKSTTMRIIAGLLKPTSGKVFVNEVDVVNDSKLAKKQLGILLEIPPLYKEMTVFDYIFFIAKLYGQNNSEANKQTNLVIDKLGLGLYKNRLIGNLSKGYKQRVGVAQSIVNDPAVVILDEPTVGLDPQTVIEMRGIIKELSLNHTVMISSHLLHEISLICDEITIIANGKLQASGSLSEIKKTIFKNRTVKIKTDSNVVDVKEFIHNTNLPFKNIEIISNDSIMVIGNTDHDYRSHLLSELVHGKFLITEFSQKEFDLEELFLQVTDKNEVI